MAIVQRQLKSNGESSVRDAITSLSALKSSFPPSKFREGTVDVEEIAKALGLAIIREAMDDDISGFLEKRLSGWVLGVNAYHHPLRQRFTIAHEVAHFVLHRGQQTQFEDQTFARRSSSRNPMEREADAFAAELLMPEDQVRSAIRNGNRSLNDLASEFGVSSLAMKYRLQALKYTFA